ncbi:hypothetical protein TVAG_415270 [Trichomonas vaginalis G3]|uniref:Uncharacterized protein n=1 Tax=Trichomonas vaginalis (strain ATCC PRA-98 / G3) TaxID=412133 RepID=A2EW57_TRIV3|nr:hypothetical protein TVAG_415270 [Trichomonas vaginalis G3]|eukprot:XP_001315316.1 hypothetical protein [Trichomonas vaginalis G3]
MTESQVSKSVSSTSQSQKDLAQLSQGKAGQLDGIFPLFDQMMQHAKLPAWFMSLIAVFMLCQMLSVGFWVYTPIYQRVSGHWAKLYEVVLEIFTFENTDDYSKPIFPIMGVSIGIAAFSFFWTCIMRLMNTKKYYIPVPYLYLSTVIFDVIDPLFIIPSAFVMNHGITGLNVEKNMNFVVEIIVGFIAYASLLFTFVLSTSLKTRSVVLSNLTFPLFDHFPITIWVSITSAFSVVSAILQFFDDWMYCIGGAIHLLINVYVIYRMAFIPFYEVWRNAICMSFGFTAVALDINFYILYFAKLTYNYTIFVFIGVLVCGYIICRFYYIWKVNKIKKELTYSEEFTNAQEYLSTLKFTGNPKRVMMYIVVGLARLCDLFIDGSLTDFVVNDGTLDSTLSILLQIVTFFPSESRKMDVLYKKVVAKRKLSVTDRFLIYQVYRIKMRRLVSDTKDTLELYNKLKAKNDACKSIIKSFWDKQESNNAFLSSMSIMINDIDDFFKASLSGNPNNLRFTNEYADFLAECKCDFDQAVKEKIKAESIGDGHNFNVDVSFRSVVNKFPRFLKDKILDTQGRRVKRTAHDKGSSSKDSKSQASSKGTSNSSQSVDIERAEMVCKKILRDSKVRLAFHHSIMDTKPIQYKVIVGNIFVDVFVILFFYIGYFIYIRSSLKWRRSSYDDIANAAYAVFYAVYANVYTSSKFAVSTGRASTSDAVLGNITIDKGNVITLLPSEWTLEHKTYYCLTESGNYLRKLLDNIAVIAEDNNPYDYAFVFLRTTSQFKVCDKASPDYAIPCSLKVQILVTNFMSNTIAGQYNQGWYTDNIYTSNDYCQILANLPILATNADIAFNSILNFNIKKASAYKPQIYAWMIVGALMIFFTISTPAVIIIQTYNYMVDKLIKVLLALPQQTKEEAKKPLMIDSEPIQDLSSQTKVATSNIMDILPRFFFLFLFICVGSYIGLCYTTLQLNDTMTKCLKWFYYSCTRITMSSQIGNTVIQIVMLNESLPNKITNRSALLTKATSDLDKLITTNKELLYGNDDISGIIGYDDTLDGLQIRNVCDLGRSPVTLHDMYACSGLDQQFQMFKNMVTEVLRKPESFGGSLKDGHSLG